MRTLQEPTASSGRLARPPERLLAAASLALVLVVIVASAAIRLSGQDLGSYLPAVRGIHRVSASLATLLILTAGVLAWRGGRRGLAAALVAATAGLSVLGAATGIAPPPWAQAGNLLGGLLLAALLAWLLGKQDDPDRILWIVLAAQAGLGAWIAIYAEELWTPVTLLHVFLGMSLAAAIGWFAVRKGAVLLILLAFAVPASGAAAALLGLPLGAMIAHSASVALLICAAAYAHARLA
jgi:heme A synthase